MNAPGERNKTHDRASRRRSENTPGSTRRYRKTKNATHEDNTCQYVCGAKIALYNV